MLLRVGCLILVNLVISCANDKVAPSADEFELSLKNILNDFDSLSTVESYESLEREIKALFASTEGISVIRLHEANISIGNRYWEIGELSKALPFLRNSLSIAREEKSIPMQLVSLDSLGIFYANYDRAEQSVKLFKEMLDLAIKSDNKDMENSAYFKLGSMLMRLSEPDYSRSLAYLHRSRLTYESNLDSMMLSKIYSNISLIHEETFHLDSAMYWMKKSIALEYNLGYYESLVISYHNLGLILYRLESYEEAYQAFEDSKLGADSLSYSTVVRDRAKALYGMGVSNFQLKNYQFAAKQILKYDTISTNYSKTEFNEMLTQKEIEFGLLEEKRKNDLQGFELDRERQKRMIYLVIFILVIVTASFLIYFLETRRRNLKASARRDQQLANQKIDELLQKQEISSLQGVLAGQEEERKRIATDLHDRLGATLGMVKLHFTAVEERIDLLREDNKKQYNKANELLDQAYSEVRSISHDLVSGVLVKFGLGPALTDLKDKLESTGKLKVQLVLNEMSERLKGEVELQIYRIIQELVSNILKHAQATEAVIQLNRTNNHINLIVEDNGVGFDPESIKEKDGIGMHNLEARVDQLNGKIHFDSGKGAGTTVSIDIPLEDKIY